MLVLPLGAAKTDSFLATIMNDNFQQNTFAKVPAYESEKRCLGQLSRLYPSFLGIPKKPEMKYFEMEQKCPFLPFFDNS
jgi:hypothetical protein